MKFRNENNEWQNIRVQNYGIEQTPIGSMIYYPSLNIPDGYLLCDGREVLIADYPLLFNAIGYIGGDDVLTGYFRLPDMQGVVPGGWNPNLVGVNHPLAGDFGDQVGNPRHALTVEELASHYHGVSDDFDTDMKYTMNLDWSSASVARRMVTTSEDSNITAMTANLNAEDSTGSGDIGQAAGTGYTGEGQEFSIVQPTKLYNWLIKAKNIVTLGGYTEDFEVRGTLMMARGKYNVDGDSAIDMNNSDITRINSMYFNDSCESYDEGINFPKNSNVHNSPNLEDYDNLRAVGGYLYFNNQKVSVPPTMQYHVDGIYDLLIAEFNSDATYRRDSLVFSVIESGSSDNADTGIVMVGFSSNDQNLVNDANISITTFGTVQAYAVCEGNNAKIYIKKTVHYRNLNVQLINRSSESRVIWHG